MRKRVAIFCIGIFCGFSLLWAQAVPDGMVSALKKGNAGALQGYFGEQVELTLQQRSFPLDKQQAERRLAEFFAAQGVQDFKVNHQGKRDETGFMVGTLATGKGNFRVNCFFRKDGNKYVIHQIRIDKSNE